MEQQVHDVLAAQTVMPKQRYIRSEGALYALLLCGAVLVMGLGNRLRAALDLPPVLVQGILYGLLLGLGYWVITYRLTGYRYTLTNRALFVTRLTGRSEKLIAEIPIEAIEYAGPCDPGRLPKKPLRALADRKEPPTMVLYREGETLCALLINARGELKNRLTEPWKEGED